MLLIVHIVIAIFTIIASLATAIKPRQNSVLLSKFSVVLTLLSGVALILTGSVSLAHLCVSGTVVVTLCTGLIYYGNRKLAFATVS